MKKILITGGSGFIGKNLREQLADDFEVYAPSSKELNLCDDAAVRAYLKEHQFDEVIHAATHNATRNSDKDLSKVFFNNVRMYFTLANCSDLYGRMFYFGSGAEYSKPHYEPKMTEDYFAQHIPEDDYGFSKYIMGMHVPSCDNIYDLRIFGCFGKYEDWELRFISNAICKTLFDLDITLRRNMNFDYLYVNDLARIMKWFLNTDTLQHRYYNVCTGQTIDLLSLAKLVQSIAGNSVEIHVAQEGMNSEYSGDNSRLLAEMGSFDFTSHEAAVGELYDWYRAQKDTLLNKELLLTDK